MHTLRNSKLIAKLVLVWFALFLSSAIASTVINPDSLQMVCTASGGMKMVDRLGMMGGVFARQQGVWADRFKIVRIVAIGQSNQVAGAAWFGLLYNFTRVSS